jgi:hypothetical protein
MYSVAVDVGRVPERERMRCSDILGKDVSRQIRVELQQIATRD